jgi:hypothetical protein
MVLTKHFNDIAPPTFFFFNKEGVLMKTRADGE